MPPVKKPKVALGHTYLREWREYRQLTQEQASSRINVSRALLSKIENAKSPYTQQFMEAAAVAYSCTVADILQVNPFKEGEVVDLMRLINDRNRDQAIRVLRALVGSTG